jgi:hypothetical protein
MIAAYEIDDATREHINEVLADKDWTRRVVSAAHVGLMLIMQADRTANLGLAQRVELYDDASLVIGSAVAGKEITDEAMDQALGNAVIEALRDALRHQEN